MWKCWKHKRTRSSGCAQSKDGAEGEEDVESWGVRGAKGEVGESKGAEINMGFQSSLSLKRHVSCVFVGDTLTFTTLQ